MSDKGARYGDADAGACACVRALCTVIETIDAAVGCRLGSRLLDWNKELCLGVAVAIIHLHS